MNQRASLAFGFAERRTQARVLKSKEKRNERKMALVEYIGNFLNDGKGDIFLENATLTDSGRKEMMNVYYPVSEYDYIWYIRKDTDQEWVFQARSIENEFGKASDQFQRNFQDGHTLFPKQTLNISELR